MEEIKNPPVANPLSKPQRPVDFDPVDMFDPGTPTGKWFVEDQQFREAKDAYRDEQMQKVINEINQDRQLKQNQQISETKKAETIAAFQSEGLDPEDSVALYSKLEQALTAPIQDGAKVFVEMFKTKPAKSVKKEKGILPPGLDGAGAIPADDESKDFMDGIGGEKNKNLFKTG